MNASVDIFRAAVEENDDDLINSAIRDCADINIRNEAGFTPLLLSMVSKTLGWIEFLKADADVNIANNDGLTPIIFCAQMGWHNCIPMLLVKGANILTPDKDGRDAYENASNPQSKAMLLLDNPPKKMVEIIDMGNWLLGEVAKFQKVDKAGLSAELAGRPQTIMDMVESQGLHAGFIQKKTDLEHRLDQIHANLKRTAEIEPQICTQNEAIQGLREKNDLLTEEIKQLEKECPEKPVGLSGVFSIKVKKEYNVFQETIGRKRTELQVFVNEEHQATEKLDEMNIEMDELSSDITRLKEEAGKILETFSNYAQFVDDRESDDSIEHHVREFDKLLHEPLSPIFNLCWTPYRTGDGERASDNIHCYMLAKNLTEFCGKSGFHYYDAITYATAHCGMMWMRGNYHLIFAYYLMEILNGRQWEAVFNEIFNLEKTADERVEPKGTVQFVMNYRKVDGIKIMEILAEEAKDPELVVLFKVKRLLNE